MEVKNRPVLKAYSIIANGVYYFINKKFLFLGNDDNWKEVTCEKKLKELWVLRRTSTLWKSTTIDLSKINNEEVRCIK